METQEGVPTMSTTALEPVKAQDMAQEARSVIDSLKTFAAGGQYGVQVDAGGTLIEDKAELADAIMQKTLELLAQRQLTGVSRSERPMPVAIEQSGQSRDHMLIRQVQSTGDVTTMALRIVPYGGRDLELSWRLFEQNPKRENRWRQFARWMIIGGIVVIPFACVLTVVGVGLIALGFAIALIVGGMGILAALRRRTSSSSYGQFDSLALAATVNKCVADALATFGVGKNDLIELKRQGVSLIDLVEGTYVQEAVAGFGG